MNFEEFFKVLFGQKSPIFSNIFKNGMINNLGFLRFFGGHHEKSYIFNNILKVILTRKNGFLKNTLKFHPV